MFVCVLFANTVQLLNQFIDFAWQVCTSNSIRIYLKNCLVFLPPPLKRKRNVSPSWEKNLKTPLNTFKTMSSIQLLLNLSKYKSEDQEIFRRSLFFDITNSAFLVLQIVHAGIIVLSEIIYCPVKWLKFTSNILIYVNLYLS